jgi:hypothetical protein
VLQVVHEEGAEHVEDRLPDDIVDEGLAGNRLTIGSRSAIGKTLATGIAPMVAPASAETRTHAAAASALA